MAKSRFVPVILDTGVVIQAEINPIQGERDVVGGVDIMKFDSVIESITGIANQFNSAIDSIAPNKATVEFSLQLSTESGKLTTLLVQGKANATIKVALEWERSKTNG